MDFVKVCELSKNNVVETLTLIAFILYRRIAMPRIVLWLA